VGFLEKSGEGKLCPHSRKSQNDLESQFYQCSPCLVIPYQKKDFIPKCGKCGKPVQKSDKYKGPDFKE